MWAFLDTVYSTWVALYFKFWVLVLALVLVLVLVLVLTGTCNITGINLVGWRLAILQVVGRWTPHVWSLLMFWQKKSAALWTPARSWADGVSDTILKICHLPFVNGQLCQRWKASSVVLQDCWRAIAGVTTPLGVTLRRQTWGDPSWKFLKMPVDSCHDRFIIVL